MKRGWWLLAVAAVLALAGFLILVASGRVAGGLGWFLVVDSDQPNQGTGPGAVLEPGQPVGQTFVARRGGLSGIEIYLLPANSEPITLGLHLRSDPQSTEDLATASMQLPARATPGFYRFIFPALDASHGSYYYAFLDTPESVSVGLAEGAAYLDGAAHQRHQPLDAQTAFRLIYAPKGLTLDLLKAVLGWAGLLAVTGLLWVVPGWSLLAWLWPGRRLAWAELLGLAVGVSLAVYPVLILWTDLVGLHLGPLYTWLPIVAGLAALAWRYRTWRPKQGWVVLRQWIRSQAFWPDVTLMIVLGLAVGVRLLAVRALDAPMWGDSYHHTMIAQLLVDNGGLFDSWAPYAELASFTYHFGFHSAVAALHWLTRMPMVESTLWAGQLLNALAVLAVYPLALRVTGSRWAAVWAVLLAGVLSPMPMFYVNWGRYTQLAGQVMLPGAVWLTWEVVEAPERRWKPLLLVALIAGGLALTHYRVLLFYAVFVFALLLLSLKPGTWRETLLRLVWAGAGAGLLFLPWFVHNIGGDNLQLLGTVVTTPADQVQPVTLAYNAVGSLETYLAPLWWLLMFIGFSMGLWQRQRGVLLMGLWWFLLLLATNPSWLSLPGTGAISNFALFIFAYLPAGLFSGVVVAHLTRARHAPATERRRLPAGCLALTAVILVTLGVLGARDRLRDLDPVHHALVTRPDVRAAAWIRDNTPPQTRFLVNSFSTYADTAIVGSDGGWWLPLLAGRANTVPPLNYASEQGTEPDYWLHVNQLARQVNEQGLVDAATLDLLRQQGVTHAYVGQRQGAVNHAGPDVIDPEVLSASPHYELLYHQDQVWIFAVNP